MKHLISRANRPNVLLAGVGYDTRTHLYLLSSTDLNDIIVTDNNIIGELRGTTRDENVGFRFVVPH
jgi:hypothetical protein